MATTNRNRYSPEKKKESRRVNRGKRSRKISWPLMAGITLVAAAVVLLIFIAVNPPGRSAAQIEGLLIYPNLDRGHTTQAVTYAQVPPAGGRHNPAWQNCGVYTEPVPNENAVHSLEHGAIWITYRPDLPAGELQKLQTLTRRSGYRLLSPYPGLPASIVASAWGYQLHLEQADDPRLLRFIQAYEQNPFGPEPGAACTGGVGQPG